MATATPTRRLVVSHPPYITASEDAMKDLRDGLANAATAAPGNPVDQLTDDELYVEQPGLAAWEKDVVDAAAAAIAPLVAQMLEDAIMDRLPWTWEEGR